MKTRLNYLYISLALVAALATLAAAPARNYRAHLSGDDAGAVTLGQGQAIFQFSQDGGELSYKLIASNIENVTMAHIHVANEPGANGPPVLWLYPYGPPPAPISGRFQGVLAERTVADGDQGVLMTLDDIKTAIKEGRAYVNLHTAQYPGGEIRGQIH